ncbi:hypothetical protein [Ilumatobacter sp.]|uniref:hypothetical protein n=1 Tax=Ilumatobacter sp. TaxID=1967498 RepID=UPI003AF8611E
MPAETVPRTWTIASWLVARTANEPDEVAEALHTTGADAIALQSLRRDDAERIADRLGADCAWELSFHPRSRLLPGSGIGLAILSRNTIGDSVSFVTNNHTSTWSRNRRIAQFAVVTRDDHSGYTIGHAVGSPDPEAMGRPPAPLVWFRPAQVESQPERAVDLPDQANGITVEATTPLATGPPLLLVTFEMPWVQGDFTTA